MSAWQLLHKPGIDFYYTFFSLESHPEFWDGLMQHAIYTGFAAVWIFMIGLFVAYVAIRLYRYVRTSSEASKGRHLT